MTQAFNIDCMEYMKTLPDKYFDLAITDPPYGISADHYNCGNGCKAQLHKAESTSVRLQKERSNMHHNSLKGAGKLKDRALNKFDSSWDKEPPNAEYFIELFRVSKNQVIWGAITLIYHLQEELSVGIKNKSGRTSRNGSTVGLRLIHRQN